MLACHVLLQWLIIDNRQNTLICLGNTNSKELANARSSWKRTRSFREKCASFELLPRDFMFETVEAYVCIQLSHSRRASKLVRE